MRYAIIHLCEKYVRNARNFHDFLHKKARNRKNFSLFSQFFVRIFLAMRKSEKCDMREMRKAKNVRNNAIREILFLAINRMCKIFEKIKKFKKCDNYCTCLFAIRVGRLPFSDSELLG